MTNKKGIVGVTLVAILIASLFAAMISPVSSTGFTFAVGKSTLTGSGGSVDNSLTYQRGDTVYYRMSFTPTSEPCNLTSAKDVFPDGTEENLASGSIRLDKDEVIGWETTWVVNGGGIGSDGTIVNYLEIKGYDADRQSFIATAPKSSNIIVTIAFTYAAT